MTQVSLYDQLIWAVRDAFPGIETLVDRKQPGSSGRNIILKYNGKTIAYLNGKRKFRIDSPRLDRKVLITHPAQIVVAVEFVGSYIPQEVE